MGHGDFDQTNLAPLHDLREKAVINWRRTDMGSTLFVPRAELGKCGPRNQGTNDHPE